MKKKNTSWKQKRETPKMAGRRRVICESVILVFDLAHDARTGKRKISVSKSRFAILMFLRTRKPKPKIKNRFWLLLRKSLFTSTSVKGLLLEVWYTAARRVMCYYGGEYMFENADGLVLRTQERNVLLWERGREEEEEAKINLSLLRKLLKLFFENTFERSGVPGFERASLAAQGMLVLWKRGTECYWERRWFRNAEAEMKTNITFAAQKFKDLWSFERKRSSEFGRAVSFFITAQEHMSWDAERNVVLRTRKGKAEKRLSLLRKLFSPFKNILVRAWCLAFERRCYGTKG